MNNVNMQLNSKPSLPYSIDPVCGMKVDASNPPFRWHYHGAEYHFCAEVCVQLFQREPEKYLTADETMRSGE